MFCNSSPLSQVLFSSILRSIGKSENGCKGRCKVFRLTRDCYVPPFVFCIPQTSQPTKRHTSKWKDDIPLYSLLILLSISKPLVTYLTAYFKSNEMVGGGTERTWQDRAVRRKGCPVASWGS